MIYFSNVSHDKYLDVIMLTTLMRTKKPGYSFGSAIRIVRKRCFFIPTIVAFIIDMYPEIISYTICSIFYHLTTATNDTTCIVLLKWLLHNKAT